MRLDTQTKLAVIAFTLAAAFCLTALCLHGQIVAPQVPLTGNIGPAGPFPVLNSGTLVFATDANHTMVNPEWTAISLKVTSGVSLTGTRNLITPAGKFFFGAIENATTGGQAIQIIGVSGTGVTIANGATVSVWNDGTNYVQVGTAGGGGLSSFTSGDLSPLFTTALGGSPTTAPALAFTIANAAQNSVLAGPASGGAGAYSFQTAPVFSAALLTGFPTFNQNTTGNAATASALAGTPSLCSTGDAPTGVLANGNATGCAAIGGGVNAKNNNFGATGNGTTDDAAALASWLAYLQSNQAVGYLPCGWYKTLSQLTWNTSVPLVIYGDSSTCAFIDYEGTSTITAALVVHNTTTPGNGYFSDVVLSNVGFAANTHASYALNIWRSVGTINTVDAMGGSISSFDGQGFNAQGSVRNLRVSPLAFSPGGLGCVNGITLEGDGTGLPSTQFSMESPNVDLCSGIGYNFSDAGGITVIGAQESGAYQGFYLNCPDECNGNGVDFQDALLGEGETVPSQIVSGGNVLSNSNFGTVQISGNYNTIDKQSTGHLVIESGATGNLIQNNNLYATGASDAGTQTTGYGNIVVETGAPFFSIFNNFYSPKVSTAIIPLSGFNSAISLNSYTTGAVEAIFAAGTGSAGLCFWGGASPTSDSAGGGVSFDAVSGASSCASGPGSYTHTLQVFSDKVVSLQPVTAPNFIDSALTPGTSPICPNGTGGAFTTTGCSGGGMTFPGANTVGVANSGNTAWRTPLYSDITALFGSGSCSGFLKSDGTCSTPSGGGTVTTSGSPVSPNVACFSGSTAIGSCTSANIQTAIGESVYDASGAATGLLSTANTWSAIQTFTGVPVFPATYTRGSYTITQPSATGTLALTSAIGSWGGLNYPTWASGTPFVKMTAAGTFALDTSTYLTTVSASSTYAPIFTLTTTGTSGAATYAANVLNIPQYTGGGTPAYPLTITGGVSGGVVYGSTATQLTVSPAGTANVLMKWGGAATAPGNSSITDNATTVTTTDTGGYVAPILTASTDNVGVGSGFPSAGGATTDYNSSGNSEMDFFDRYTTNGGFYWYSGTSGAGSLIARLFPNSSLVLAGATAGFVAYGQGSTSAAVTGCNGVSSQCEQAATATTAGVDTRAPALAQGIAVEVGTASAVQRGYSGDSGHSTAVTIGSGTSIGSTSLCSTTLCPVGTYRVNAYVDITTACTATGTYLVNLIYTDDQGSKTSVVNLNGTGAVPATGVLTTTSTANFGQEAQILRSTGAASINYSTTATACGSGGPMVGHMYLSVEAVQ